MTVCPEVERNLLPIGTSDDVVTVDGASLAVDALAAVAPSTEPKLGGVGGPELPTVLAPVLERAMPFEPEVPGLAGGGVGGVPDGAARPTAQLIPPLNANPDATAPAVMTPLTTVIRVLPTSPRTMRLAMKGIRATMIASSALATLITIIWLEPTNACSQDPLNCMGSVICRADISA